MIQATAPVIDGWLAACYDLDADILPILQARTLRKRADPIRSEHGRISLRPSRSATPRGWRWRRERKVLWKREVLPLPVPQ